MILRSISRSTTWLAVIAMSLSLVVIVPAPASEAQTDSTAEARFIDSVNAERAARGVPRLQVATDLRDVARRHSVRMADQGRLHHNPNLGSDVRSWRRVTENVGRGPSTSALHAALMASEGHRNNILDSNVTQIGVGVEVRGSTVWVTQVYRKPTSPSSARFSDVSITSTHGRDIERLARSGLTTGCGSGRYCPNRNVTREEMASFLARASNLPAPTVGTRFSDVPRGSTHASDIEAIARVGITQGCGTRRYCPTRSVSRAEMASFLTRALDLPPAPTTGTFRDVPGGSTHVGDIEALARAGITSGCGTNRYCPDRPVTRAEMASFLVRAYGL